MRRRAAGDGRSSRELLTVVLGAYNDTATLKRSVSAIQVNGADCGAATVVNTDKIRVNGTIDSFQGLVVDLSGGPFAPGKTAEAGTGQVSEIELEVNFDAGARTTSSGADSTATRCAGAPAPTTSTATTATT